MSSAKNHARRSRRGYHVQKSITGGYAAKTWVRTAEKKRLGNMVDLFRQMWIQSAKVDVLRQIWNRLTMKA